MNTSHVPGLDLMRAYAILCVLYAHFLDHIPHDIFGPSFLLNGLIGVEMFFVLSGFLIGGILLRQTRSGTLESTYSLFNFWKRRGLRTLPNYFLFMGVFCLWDPQDFGTIFQYSTFTQSLLTPIPNFYSLSWSLVVEEWFYFLFPACLFLNSFITSRWKVAFFSSALMIMLVSILWSLTLPFQGNILGWNLIVRMSLFPRLSAIMLGVLAAYAKSEAESKWARLQRLDALLLLPIVTMSYLSLSLSSTYEWFLRSRELQIVFLPLFSSLCALTLPYFDSLRNQTAWWFKPVSWLSQVSYSLYLCHIPVLWLINTYILHIGWDDIALRKTEYLLLYVLGSMIVADLVHRFWERPWLSVRDRLTPMLRGSTAQATLRQ
jgi:peptidoglycan/LPS O-acetylase OafA/YrhL